LDLLAKSLNKELKESSEESYIKAKTTANKLVELKFEIVKHIIVVKLEEAEAKKTAADKRAQKQKIMQLIDEKKDAALSAKSLEELQAELDKMD
jgi:N-acetylmuramic acid 6-phosphate (MurNAc-6-P) etherase